MFSVHTVSTVQKFGMKTKNTEKEASWAQQNPLNWLQNKSQGMRLFEHRFFRAFTVGLGQSLFGAFGKRDSVGWCFTFPEQISGSAHISWRIDVFFLQEVNGQPLGLWNIGKPPETMNWFIGFIEDWRSYTTSLRRSRGFGFSLRSGSNECLADLPGSNDNWAFSYEKFQFWKSGSQTDPWDSVEVCHPSLLPRGSCLWPCIRSWDGCQLLVKHHAFHNSHLTHSEASIRN